jgi:hypothetical protein
VDAKDWVPIAISAAAFLISATAAVSAHRTRGMMYVIGSEPAELRRCLRRSYERAKGIKHHYEQLRQGDADISAAAFPNTLARAGSAVREAFELAELSDDVEFRQFITHASAALLLIEMSPNEDQEETAQTLVADLGKAIRRLDVLERRPRWSRGRRDGGWNP